MAETQPGYRDASHHITQTYFIFTSSRKSTTLFESTIDGHRCHAGRATSGMPAHAQIARLDRSIRRSTSESLRVITMFETITPPQERLLLLRRPRSANKTRLAVPENIGGTAKMTAS